ncbi:hypothetical protein F4861DRAFT_495837 [Xylaria intraflava]|nr:hypothetical protein F4861DRAFT_495837 [Xylaria intraflava]
MEGRRSWLAWLQALFICLLIHSHATLALSWRGRTGVQSVRHTFPLVESSNSASHLLQAGAPLQSAYEMALNELRELESEPLCHRIAARLLVSNCQLLDGKDEATILTDSGRKIRDFVDAYAASLAICDLERGSFVIPSACTKFQETTLSQLPSQDTAHLHVTSNEIDTCLSGLGTSDSAWNTWVSYRHKALRFCEAARADNEKAQHVLVIQRAAKLMGNIVDACDAKAQKSMDDLSMYSQLVGDKFASLLPRFQELEDERENAFTTFMNRLGLEIENTSQYLTGFIQQLVQEIQKNATEGYAEVAAAHEQSLHVINQQTTSEIGRLVELIQSAKDLSVIIYAQLEISHLQATKIISTQENIEQNMDRLIDDSNKLISRQDALADRLEKAENITNNIVGGLGNIAASVAAIGNLFSGHRSLGYWWPYIWCPVASLVMGSYGLRPSMLRNLALVALGETAGFLISLSSSLSFGVIRTSTAELLGSFIRPLQMSDNDFNSTNLTSQFESL